MDIKEKPIEPFSEETVHFGKYDPIPDLSSYISKDRSIKKTMLIALLLMRKQLK